MTSSDEPSLDLQGIDHTAREDACSPQILDGNSTKESLPPLLRMISAGNYSFMAKDSPDATNSDLESGYLFTNLGNGPFINHPQASEGDGENYNSSPDRTTILANTFDDTSLNQTNLGFDELTPKSILAKRGSPALSPTLQSEELSKRVSFGTKELNGEAHHAAKQITQTASLEVSKQPSKKKFFSQPNPTSAQHPEMNGGHPHSGPVCGTAADTSEGAKEGNYEIFRTKSIERQITRQITRLQSRQRQEQREPSDSASTNNNGEDRAMPAGRYFDALKGPELDILRDSEELLLPLDQQWPFLLRFPVGCFGISLGLGSQTMLWKMLANSSSMSFLHVPLAINFILWWLALVTFFTIFIIYSLKCLFYFEAVRREYYHPVRINFFFAPWIACMFLTLGVPPSITTSAHPALWCVFMAPIFILELKIYGQWLSGGQRRLSKVANPSTHLSLVGNFVGALLAATVGWKEPAIFFWAVGAAHYLVLFVTLYQRLPTAEALPKELHPVFFLFVAAPSAASVAWKYIAGDFDYVSRAAYFVGLFLYSSLVIRLNFFRGFQFSVAWWAYTFPMTASAIATIHYSLEIRHPITQGLAVVLSLISSVTVFTLFFTTILHALVWRSLFPNDIAIAITNRRHKRKHKGGKSDFFHRNKVDRCKESLSTEVSISNENSLSLEDKTLLESLQSALLSAKSDPLPLQGRDNHVEKCQQ